MTVPPDPPGPNPKSVLAGHLYGLAKRPFVRDVLTMQVGSALYISATFLSSVVFARVLGVEIYGTYAVILSLVGTVQVFTNLGQGSSLLVFLAEEYGKKNVSGMAAVLRNFFNIALVNALILCILAFAAPEITLALYGNATLGQYARVLFLFQAVDSVNSMTIIVLQALRRIRQKVLFEQGENLSFLGCATLSLLLGGGLWGIILSQLAVGLVFLGIAIVVILQLTREEGFPRIRAILTVPFASTRSYFHQGLLIAVDKNLGNLFPQGLFFIWSLFVPVSVVGIARLAVQLATLPRQILLPSVGDLSTTVLAQTRAEGMRSLRMNAARVIKHALALQTVLSLLAALAIPFAIVFLYGRAYSSAIPVALWILLLSMPVSLCLTNSVLLRLLRKIHYSMIQAILSWLLMIGILVLGSRETTGYVPFIVAYGLGQAMPMTITFLLFTRLLRKETRI